MAATCSTPQRIVCVCYVCAQGLLPDEKEKKRNVSGTCISIPLPFSCHFPIRLYPARPRLFVANGLFFFLSLAAGNE